MPKDFSETAEFFRESARSTYQGYPNDSVETVYLEAPSDLVSISHVFRSSSESRLHIVTPNKVVEKATEQLGAIGLKEFSYVTRGSSAVCLKSDSSAIRVGIWPKKVRHRTDLGDIRDPCPLILQPEHSFYFDITKIKFGSTFEVLPFIQMINDFAIPEDFQHLVHAILNGTCFEANAEFKDLGVLPDGTPIYVDPGAINLKDKNQQPTAEDFQKIVENTKRLEWPEDLSWVLPDGSFKQEKFFPKPQNSVNSVFQL